MPEMESKREGEKSTSEPKSDQSPFQRDRIKAFFLSNAFAQNLHKIGCLLSGIWKPQCMDVATAVKRCLFTRVLRLCLCGLCAQYLHTIPFFIFTNVSFDLEKWFFNAYNATKNWSFNNLYSACFYYCAYGSLVAMIYARPITTFCATRFDVFVNGALRKLSLFAAQLIFVFWYIHAFRQYLSQDFDMNYLRFTAVCVVVWNFWRRYLFRENRLKFELINPPTYEHTYYIWRPDLAKIFRRVFTPVWKFTLLYFTSMNAFILSDGPKDFEFFLLDIRDVLGTLVLIALLQNAICSQHSLVNYELTRCMEFSVEDHRDGGKVLLNEAIQAKKLNYWIFQHAARDIFAISRNEARYRELYVIPSNHTHCLWKDISDRCLDIIRDFSQALAQSYELPEKLFDKQLIERLSVNELKRQNFFKHLTGRDSYMENLRAPTLCSCPLGPIQQTKTMIMEFTYSTMAFLRILHLWHYLFCETYGARVRYALKDSESIQYIVCAFSNVCVAANDHNELNAIKFSVVPFIEILIQSINVLEVVPFRSHELYGLDADSFGKLKSLKAHAKYALFNLLLTFQHKLVLFTLGGSITQHINRFVQQYKWPIKLQ